ELRGLRSIVKAGFQMTPRLGHYVAGVGLLRRVLCAVAATVTQISCAAGPPENGWGDNILEMGMFPLLLMAVAIEEEANFNLIGMLLLHAGGFLGLTVMAVGLAMAGAGARVKGGAPRIGLSVVVA